MQIPLTPNLRIESFISGQITSFESAIKNGVLEKDEEGRVFVTQRPSVNVTADPSDSSVSDVAGRGIYDWAAVGSEYFVNNGEVYKGDYSTTVREAAQSVTSLTSASTTATATVTSHGYLTGDTVVISGATQTEYNGTYTVTVTGANTFTYTFAGSATTPATGTITARRAFKTGTERVYFFELGDYLVILDPENNEGWYIASGTSTVLHKITNSNFPPNQTPALQLAKGGFVLNNRLYVPTTSATLHGSPSEDPSATWDALNVISAEFDPDGGVIAFKANETGVFCGPRTTEFLYDAANPTGSPLSPRTDIQHGIGAASEHSFWENNGVVYFIGQSATGEISAYKMAGMQITKISKSDIDSFLTTSITTELKSVVGSGVAIGGRVLYMLTVYHLVGSTPTAIASLVYDASTNTWGYWDLQQVDYCPVVDWTKATQTESSKGILLDGKLVEMIDDFVPNDRTSASGWVQSGWVQSGWVSQASTDGTPIDLEIITGRSNLGTNNRKFASSYRIDGKPSSAAQSLSLSWANETNTYGTARTIDLSNPGQRAARCGSFRFRNHKLTGSPTERIRLYTLEAEIEAGNS